MGMVAFNLKNLDEIHLGKFNIVYESAEAVTGQEISQLVKTTITAQGKFGGLYSRRNAHSRNLYGAEVN